MQCTVKQVNRLTMLVEYTDDAAVPQRVWLPLAAGAATGSRVEIDQPAQGVPYADLVFYADVVIRADDLNRALRQVGLWTRADLMRTPSQYVNTVVGLAGLSLSSILQRKE